MNLAANSKELPINTREYRLPAAEMHSTAIRKDHVFIAEPR